MASIAVLIDDDFEDSEYRLPVDRLRAVGHDVTVAGAEAGAEYTGKQGRARVTADVATQVLDAGAEWLDDEVVIDGTLITSRQPDDLVAFTAAPLAALPPTT